MKGAYVETGEDDEDSPVTPICGYYGAIQLWGTPKLLKDVHCKETLLLESCWEYSFQVKGR